MEEFMLMIVILCMIGFVTLLAVAVGGLSSLITLGIKKLFNRSN